MSDSSVVENTDPADVDALTGLLNEALNDFSRVPKQPRCSDDDLDEFLSHMDAEATKKAAVNFEKILEQVAAPQTFDETDMPMRADTSAASHDFLSSLLGIDQFLNDESADPEIRVLTNTILKDCFTKDVILPLIKTFREIIDNHLADEGTSMSDDEKSTLTKQKMAFDELIQSYKSLSDPPTDAQVEHQNELWIKLRDLGNIPPAILSHFESKVQADNGGAFNAMMSEISPDASQCSIM